MSKPLAKRTPRALRRFKDLTMMSGTVIATILAVVPLTLIVGYLIWYGFSSINLATFTKGPTPMGDPGGGLRNSIVGTLILLAIASCIGLPIGILGGIYQLEFGGGKIASTVRFLTDVLNSIPSIIVGLFVYVAVVMPIAKANPGKYGYSAIAGGIALGILMIPTIMRSTEEMLRLVPISLRDGALALGSARWRAMWNVTLPAARGGVITGVMLALARVAGETAPLLFTAFGNTQFSVSPLQPINALPLDIFNYAMQPYDYLHRLALAGALILVLMILTMSIFARRFSSRGAIRA